MALYFVCPGDATTTDTTVTCSQSITTLDASANQPYFTNDEISTLLDSGIYCFATLLVCLLIKKALDI